VKKARNPQVFFGLSGAVLLGATGFLFMQNQALNSRRAEVVQLRKQDQEQQKIFTQLDDSKKQLADLQTKLVHLEQGVPDAAYVPTMLKELELAGKKQGIEVTGLRPMTKRPTAGAKDKELNDQKPYQPLDLELKGRGKYSDLQAFVETLNTFPKIVAVRTITIAPIATSKSAAHGLEITIGLRAFVFPSKGAKPGGGSV
jgi:Tfp pilus assembly protein PilO